MDNKNNSSTEQSPKTDTKFKNKCEMLRAHHEECVSLNKYIMGPYYNEKLCKYIKLNYLKECNKL
jgi:hypothetical protein